MILSSGHASRFVGKIALVIVGYSQPANTEYTRKDSLSTAIAIFFCFF